MYITHRINLTFCINFIPQNISRKFKRWMLHQSDPRYRKSKALEEVAHAIGSCSYSIRHVLVHTHIFLDTYLLSVLNWLLFGGLAFSFISMYRKINSLVAAKSSHQGYGAHLQRQCKGQRRTHTRFKLSPANNTIDEGIFSRCMYLQ